MSPNLGTLALYTGTSPAVDICVHTRPYKPGHNELLGCSDSWIRQTMKGVKHSTSPCQWDEGALCSCGHVTVKWGARVSQWDSFHDQCRRWGGLESCGSVACVLAIAAKSTVGGWPESSALVSIRESASATSLSTL